MSDFFYLIPVALGMGAIGLGVFLWSLRSGQYEDLDGAAERILFDEEDVPIRNRPPSVTPDDTRRLE
jgi:cbb3-type cytochrome oxidase maturation protein